MLRNWDESGRLLTKQSFMVEVMVLRYLFIYVFYLFSHLADSFIQSNLQMRTL